MSASLATAAAAATGRAAETLALRLWAEAATRSVRAIEAVASLVVNRARLAATDAPLGDPRAIAYGAAA